MINQLSMLMEWYVLSVLKLDFYCTEEIFYKRIINKYGVYVTNKETRQECFVHFEVDDMYCHYLTRQ